MSNYYKYEKYQKYINGVPADPPVYQRGELIGIEEYDSIADCEKAAIYRWVETGTTVCSGYSLHNQEKRQKSTDGGITWTDTSPKQYRAGAVVEQYSTECGWRLQERWVKTGKTICNRFALSEEYIKEVSYDMGTTWQVSNPPEYKYEEISDYDDNCVKNSEPLTYEFTITTPQEVNIDIPEKAPFYVDWGAGQDTYASLPNSLSRDYTEPGTYTVKVYGLYTGTAGKIVINGCSWEGPYGTMKYDCWIDGIVGFYGAWDLLEGNTYKIISWGDTIHDLVNIYLRSRCSDFADSTETKSLARFECHSKELQIVLPSNFFRSSNLLNEIQMSGSGIIEIPEGCFLQSHQVYFNNSFRDCKNLTKVGRLAISKVGDKNECYDAYFSNPDLPASKAYRAVKEKDIDLLKEAISEGAYLSMRVGSRLYTSKYDSNLTYLIGEPIISEVDSYTISDKYIIRYDANCSAGLQLGQSDSTKYAYNGPEDTPADVVISQLKPVRAEYNVYYKNMEYQNCFAGCTALQTVEYQRLYDPNSVVKKGNSIFEGCTSLKNIELDMWVGNSTYNDSAIITSSPIVNYIFRDCTSLTDISKIKIKEVYISNNNVYFDGGNQIGLKGLFENCTSLEVAQLTGISDALKTGSNIFKGCSNLKEVRGHIVSAKNQFNLPSLQKITDFSCEDATNIATGCTNLTSFNGKITKIADYAFKDCPKLVNINVDMFSQVPNTLSAISCFESCTSLNTVPSIPTNQANMNLTAMFRNCTSLTSIPDDLISNEVIADQLDNIVLVEMFKGCINLANYPINSGFPIWDWERFEVLDGIGKVANHQGCFASCNKIVLEVKDTWGGLSPDKFGERPTIIGPNSEPYKIKGIALRLKYGDIDNYQPLDQNIPANVECQIWFPKNQKWETFPAITKVTDFGSQGMPTLKNFTNLQYAGIGPDEMVTETQFEGFYSPNLTYIDKDFFKSGQNLNSVIISAVENKVLTELPILGTNLPNVAGPKDIFNNLRAIQNLNGTLAGTAYQTTAQFGPQSSTIRWNNLQSVDYLFENCHNITDIRNFMAYTITPSIKGLFKGCINLTTLSSGSGSDTDGPFWFGGDHITHTDEAFMNCTSLKKSYTTLGPTPKHYSDVREFCNSGIVTTYIYPPGEQIDHDVDWTECFKDCKDLTSIIILENLSINGTLNMTRMFQNCTSLTATPTYRGKKLWEWNGVQDSYGYAIAKQIIGTECFKGCTQLADYNEIPDNWK